MSSVLLEQISITGDEQTVSTTCSDTTLNNLLTELNSLRGQVEHLVEWKSSIDGGTKSMKEAFTVKEMQAKLPQVKKYGTIICRFIYLLCEYPNNEIFAF